MDDWHANRIICEIQRQHIRNTIIQHARRDVLNRFRKSDKMGEIREIVVGDIFT